MLSLLRRQCCYLPLAGHLPRACRKQRQLQAPLLQLWLEAPSSMLLVRLQGQQCHQQTHLHQLHCMLLRGSLPLQLEKDLCRHPKRPSPSFIGGDRQHQPLRQGLKLRAMLQQPRRLTQPAQLLQFLAQAAPLYLERTQLPPPLARAAQVCLGLLLWLLVPSSAAVATCMRLGSCHSSRKGLWHVLQRAPPQWTQGLSSGVSWAA